MKTPVKYEAGQLWTKGDEWFCVTEVGHGHEWVSVVSSGCPEEIAEHYPSAEIDSRFPGYTLSNPKGLREAAEKAIQEWDSWNHWSLMEPHIGAIRAALQQSATPSAEPPKA